MTALMERTGIVVVIALAAATACASAGSGGATSQGALSAAEIEAIYAARMDSARARFTPADVRFMSDMIHHHAQAIEISQLVPERTSSGAIRTLAARIINAQRDEITRMENWLRARGQPVPEVHPTGHMHHAMPGMLTPEQVRELEAARGDAFDRLFLTRMIAHHEGAVSMVHELFATDGAAQDEDVFRFASDVQVDQATEVVRMELMLAAMKDRP